MPLARTLAIAPDGKPIMLDMSLANALYATRLADVAVCLVIDLSAAAQSVAEYAGDGEKFTAADLAKLADVEKHIAYRWQREDRIFKALTLGAGCRAGHFARPELLVAIVAGHMHRAGYRPDAIRKVAAALRRDLAAMLDEEFAARMEAAAAMN